MKLFLSFFIGAYLLKNASDLRKWVESNILVGDITSIQSLFDSIDNHMYKILFGSILTILATSVIGAAVFTILNMLAPAPLQIPYPVLLGILCGIATLVPGIGLKIVWIPLFFFLIIQAYLNDVLLTEFWFFPLFIVVVNLFVDFTPDLLLRPFLSGREIHKGSLMLIYILSPMVFGFVGLFLGPIILVLSINFLRLVFPRMIENGK